MPEEAFGKSSHLLAGHPDTPEKASSCLYDIHQMRSRRDSLAELRHEVARGSVLQAPHGWTTGIPVVDAMLGDAGIPAGRLTEIFGRGSCGQTSLAYALLAGCTQTGNLGALLDPAGEFFAPAAETAGIVVSRLIVVRPDSPAAYRHALDTILRSGACAIVVAGGITPEVLPGRHCVRLLGAACKNGTAFVALSDGTHPDLAAYASLRIHAGGIQPLWASGADAGPCLRGYDVALRIVKSKVGARLGECTFEATAIDAGRWWPVAHAHQAGWVAHPPARQDARHALQS